MVVLPSSTCPCLWLYYLHPPALVCGCITLIHLPLFVVVLPSSTSPCLWLQFIHQNGGFTKVWVSLKTVFFPTIVAIMVWFWRRISLLTRPPALLEYMLMVLGAALTFLNCEYIWDRKVFFLYYNKLLAPVEAGWTCLLPVIWCRFFFLTDFFYSDVSKVFRCAYL